MTFIVGLQCCDGVVLCTDSLEEDGITKKRVDKISLMRGVGWEGAGWGVAIAGAGGGGIVDKFCNEVRARLPRGAFDHRSIENTVETILAEFHANYTDRFDVLVAAYSTPTATHLLWRADAGSNVLSPVVDEVHLGTGNSLWRFICDALYDKRNSVEDNMKVAIFATRLAIQYASGVGEPIQAVSYTVGNGYWNSPSARTFFFTDGASAFSAKKALQSLWAANNPPMRVEQMKKFGGVRTPGDELIFLDGVKMEGLASVSGRRKFVNSFWCNRDRLRKHALLEQERAKSQESNSQ